MKKHTINSTSVKLSPRLSNSLRHSVADLHLILIVNSLPFVYFSYQEKYTKSFYTRR